MRAPVLVIPADVAEPDDCQRMIATAADELGRLDILVNNAALFAILPLMDASAAEAARFFAVNAIGPLNAAARSRVGQSIANAAARSSTSAASLRESPPRASRSIQRRRRRSTASPGRWRSNGLDMGCASMRSRRAMSRPKGCFRTCGPAGSTRRPCLRGYLPDGSPTATTSRTPSSSSRATRARHILGHVLTVDGGEGF